LAYQVSSFSVSSFNVKNEAQLSVTPRLWIIQLSPLGVSLTGRHILP
jgi:hypothetical protein